MREILFRGKTSDGEWIEGYYCNLGGNHPRVLKENIFIGKIGRVLELKNIDVIPETVGQYTGLTDKNGTKIFEGDIIRFKDNIGYVIYTDDDASFLVDSPNKYIAMDYSNEFEIIGNIYDNPELMKGGEK